MTTTVQKVIGVGGDYSTVQAWEDACPADLVTADQIWQGECKAQSFGTTGNTLTIAGTTTDATRYLHLTTWTAFASSFSDHASVQTNALRADVSLGALITSSSNYNEVVSVSVANTRISKLQITSTGASGGNFPLRMSAGDCFVNNCILEVGNAAGRAFYSDPASGTNTVTNTLHIQRAASAGAIAFVFGGYLGVNNTYVVPSDKTAATYGIDWSYPSATLKNCAVFGAAAVADVAPGGSYITCYTDVGSPPSGFTQVAYDTSTGSGFQNITDATRDYRIKSTSALKDTGTTDATNAPLDIAFTSRPQGSAYDVGCWELVQSLAPVLSAATVTSITATGASPRVTITFP